MELTVFMLHSIALNYTILLKVHFEVTSQYLPISMFNRMSTTIDSLTNFLMKQHDF